VSPPVLASPRSCSIPTLTHPSVRAKREYLAVQTRLISLHDTTTSVSCGTVDAHIFSHRWTPSPLQLIALQPSALQLSQLFSSIPIQIMIRPHLLSGKQLPIRSRTTERTERSWSFCLNRHLESRTVPRHMCSLARLTLWPAYTMQSNMLELADASGCKCVPRAPHVALTNILTQDP
jgi:hypothetical protein